MRNLLLAFLPYQNLAPHIRFIDIASCDAVTTRHSFVQSLEHYTAELSFGSQLYRHGHKSFLGDAKKVIAYKILPR
jgi:hypothetical protein